MSMHGHRLMKKTSRDATMYNKNGNLYTVGAVISDSDPAYPGSENMGSVIVTHPASPSASDARCVTHDPGSPPCNSKEDNVAVKRPLDLTNLGENVNAFPVERVTRPRLNQEVQRLSFDTQTLPIGRPRLFGPLICAKFPRAALYRS